MKYNTDNRFVIETIDTMVVEKNAVLLQIAHRLNQTAQPPLRLNQRSSALTERRAFPPLGSGCRLSYVKYRAAEYGAVIVEAPWLGPCLWMRPSE